MARASGSHRAWLRVLFGFAVLLVLVFASFWLVVTYTVQLDFLVYPGGNDVVVRDNGRRISPDYVTATFNGYRFRVLAGVHTITLTKPGYDSYRRTLVLHSSTVECYPVFRELRRQGGSVSGRTR